MGERRFLPVLLVTILLCACFSAPKTTHNFTYKNRQVTMEGVGHYQVGPLSKEWKTEKSQGPSILFEHHKTGSTITTQAFCNELFEDLPLSVLTNHLFVGLENVQRISKEGWPLSQRNALYTKATAEVDGVPVFLNLVIVKKNRCSFDFINIQPKGEQQDLTNDFLQFVKGFSY